MANVKDIKLTPVNEGLDDVFINPNTGDFLVADSDTQHVKDIVNAWVGWWKEYPTLGVGAKRFLGGSGGIQRLKSRVQVALKADGYKAQKVTVVNGQLYVAGERIIKQ